jgi:hypothetical protein
MLTVKVVGVEDERVAATTRLIRDVARASGVTVRVERVESMEAIAETGVLRTPAVLIGDRVVHAGGIPPRHIVESWL